MNRLRPADFGTTKNARRLRLRRKSHKCICHRLRHMKQGWRHLFLLGKRLQIQMHEVLPEDSAVFLVFHKPLPTPGADVQKSAQLRHSSLEKFRWTCAWSSDKCVLSQQARYRHSLHSTHAGEDLQRGIPANHSGSKHMDCTFTTSCSRTQKLPTCTLGGCAEVAAIQGSRMHEEALVWLRPDFIQNQALYQMLELPSMLHESTPCC